MHYHLSPSNIYLMLIKSGFYEKPKKRKLIPVVLEKLDDEFLVNGGFTLVQLPTGYGKTSIVYSLALYGICNPKSYIRTLHVLPLRSIINDAYRGFIEGADRIGLRSVEDLVARQMMYVPGSPFLNRMLVFTTFDTFMMHLMKLPPPEIEKIVSDDNGWRSFGHYEVSRGAILESVVVLDEPQLLLDSPSSRNVLASAICFLAKARVPTVIMTATLPNELREYVKEWCKRENIQLRSIIYGENIRDDEFESIERSKNIKSEIRQIKKIQDIAKIFKKEYGQVKRILLVLNTVKRAISVYREIMDMGLKPVLLHGRMIAKDRDEAIKELKKDEWIAISTQVVEAGVNISAEVLITDAAPASSLIQRAGRVARFDEKEGKVIVIVDPKALSGGIYHVYDVELTQKTIEVLEKYREIAWRIPKVDDGVGYNELLNMAYECGSLVPRIKYIHQMLDPYTSSKDAVFYVLGGDFIRESNLVNVFVIDEDVDMGYGEFYSKYLNYVFPATLEFVEKIRSKSMKVLLYRQGRILSKSDYREINNMLRMAFPQIYMIYHRIIGVQISTDMYMRVAYGATSS